MQHTEGKDCKNQIGSSRAISFFFFFFYYKCRWLNKGLISLSDATSLLLTDFSFSFFFFFNEEPLDILDQLLSTSWWGSSQICKKPRGGRFVGGTLYSHVLFIWHPWHLAQSTLLVNVEKKQCLSSAQLLFRLQNMNYFKLSIL